MSRTASPGLQRIPPRPPSVLIVDDDILIREQLTVVFRNAGYRVETAKTGEEALQDLDRVGCHAVIADWEMPDMDGPSLCRLIRGRQRDPYIYVLLFTIRRSSGDVVSGLDAGADDYIVKGTPMDELVARFSSGLRLLPNYDAASDLAPTLDAVSELAPDSAESLDNPEAFAMALAREYELCRLQRVPLSLILCAPDDAGELRDRFGSHVGAEFLASLRAEIPKLLLKSDWVARFGRDGFLVALPETDLDGASFIAQKIRAATATLVRDSSATLSTTWSIGAASIATSEDFERYKPADLLRTSEKCLAFSRSNGGDQVTAAPVTTSSKDLRPRSAHLR